MASVADRLAAVPTVRAVAIVGSHASGTAGKSSDVDLFIYCEETPDAGTKTRAAVADDLADPSHPAILGVAGHPNTDAWILKGTSTWVDAMYWTTAWAEDELDWRLVRYAANAGYTTAFWRSIRSGIPIFELDEWHSRLQQRAASPYPDELRLAIIRLNLDLIATDNPFSFRHQAANAADRNDAVALHQAATKWIASYFDVLFAANRVLHPGEKRLLDFAERDCARLPANFMTDITTLVETGHGTEEGVADHMDLMIQRLHAAIDSL